MAQTVYTLIFPVAVECSQTGEMTDIRIVKCRVSTNEINSVSKNKNMSNLFQYELCDIDIAAILDTSVYTVSLVDMSKDKTLRNKLCNSLPRYHLLSLRGVAAITYVCTDGQIINPYVYHPLVSHKGDKITKIHGFFDYTGKFHTDIQEIPMRPAFSEDIKKLRENKFCMMRNDELPLPLHSAETLTASLPSVAVTSSHCFLQVSLKAPLRVGTTATEAAVQSLLGNPYIRHAMNTMQYTRNADIPVISVPEGVQCAYITEDKPVLQGLKLPTTLKQLNLKVHTTPQLQGIEQTHLTHLIMYVEELTQFYLPAKFKATLDVKGTYLVLQCCKKAHYMGEVLNLSPMMYDAHDLQLVFYGQPWDTVCMPLAITTIKYVGRIERPVFNLLVTMPQLQTVSLSKITHCATVCVEFDANIAGAKQVNINFQTVQNWVAFDVVAKTAHNNGYADVDGTKQILNICVGTPMVVKAYNQSFATLNVSTDCSISENILANYIPTLLLFIRKPVLEKGQKMAAAGTTHIKANVERLCILIDSYAKEGPTKDIYIDGCVKNIEVSFTTALTEKYHEMNIKRIRIHVKRGSVITFARQKRVYTYGNSFAFAQDAVNFKTHTQKLDVSQQAAELILIQDL